MLIKVMARPDILTRSWHRLRILRGVSRRRPVMSASRKPSSVPRVVRIETMSLDLDELAVVIELDQAPPRDWARALDRELGEGEGLEGATARFDGRFVYIVGLEPGLRSPVQRVNRVLLAVQGRSGEGGDSPAAANVRPGHALHA